MTLGLILLAIVAVLIFFGVTESFFRKIGLKNWLAFVLVMGLVIGAVAPFIKIGMFSVNVGGFLLPLLIMVVFLAVMKNGLEILKSVIAMLAVASAAVTTRILIEPNNAGLILSASLIIGFVGGAVSYLASKTRAGAIAAVLGGVTLGDIILNCISVFAFNGNSFVLGSYGVFDSLVIGVCFSMLLTESINAIRRLNTHRRIAGLALNMEAADDQRLSDNDCAKLEPPDYDGFFDEFI